MNEAIIMTEVMDRVMNGKKSEKKGFALLMQWAGRNRWYIYGAIFMAFLSSLCGIIPYFIFYRIMDRAVLGTFDISYAIRLFAILILTTLVRVVCNVGASLSSHKGAYNTLFQVRCMVTRHMAGMPLGALNDRGSGQIKYVMNDSIEKLELFLAHNLPELVLYMSGPLVLFIYLLTVHVKLALLSILPLLFVILVMAGMFARFFKFMPVINETGGRLSGAISEYVNGMRVIKAYNMSVHSFRKYSEAIQDQHKTWCDIARATGPFYAAYVVLLESGILFLVPAGGWLYIHGQITAGVLLLFAFVGTQYLTDIRPLQELSSNLSFALNGVNQVKEILDIPVFEGGASFPERHDIELDHVSFSYNGSDQVLENVSLHIAHGERVAIVGESGAGKSTLVQLISRFYDTTEGMIRIGGRDIREIDYEKLLENISVVFQESFLTRGSIFENIAMGKDGATLEMVRAAAKAAQIDDFIMSLKDGYDTRAESYGSRFSGGQKQRICIARAILKNAPILILDEATSAADPENQVEIDRAIENLCKGKTVMIVAHRLGIVKNCDRIIVVEKKGISGYGRLDELLESNAYLGKVWEQYHTARNIQYRLPLV